MIPTPAPAGLGEAFVYPAEDFLEVLCGHQELLDAEFDAIVAANWPHAPTPPPRRSIGGGDHRYVYLRSTGRGPRGVAMGWCRTGAWPRQRSPPGPRSQH